jgi:putative transposase
MKSHQSSFTRGVEKRGMAISKRKDGSALLWQHRYWEHTIRDEEDLNRHIDYVRFNPVKHGWAHRVADWFHSSFDRYVHLKVLPKDWGDGGLSDMDVREPI